MIRDKDYAAGYVALFFGSSPYELADRAQEYHHYVVARSAAEGSTSGYFQIDPYALNSSELWGIERDSSLSLAEAVKNPSVVMNHLEPRVAEDIFLKSLEMIPVVHSHAQKLQEAVDSEYKSSRLFDVLTNVFVGQSHTDILQRCGLRLIDDEPSRMAELEGRIQLLGYRKFRLAVIDYHNRRLNGNRAADTSKKSPKKPAKEVNSDENAEALFEAAQLYISSEMKTSTQARDEFKEMLSSLVVATYMELYMRDQEALLGSISFGMPSVAVELAEPEFMIGAMYMNHYATHRKNGIINIAKELSRLSPSQLLWLSAHQEVLDDERIAAVDAIIKSLPEARVASSVNIARHIV